MKTKIFLSNGKYYEVDMCLKDLVEKHLHDESGQLKQTIVHFGEFSINPSQIVSLEEVNDSGQKRIGY